MVRYMIIGMPRSRTTWFANLFTTGSSICMHDAFGYYNLDQLNNMYKDKYFGISDTSIYLAGDIYLNKIPIKKVIIHRSQRDIEASMGGSVFKKDMRGINGLHVDYDDIDDRIEEIWNYCLNIPFDKDRYEILKSMNVQPHFEGLTPANQEIIKQFVTKVLV